MRTLQLRLKDKHAATLLKMACQVNTAWNFLNETSERSIRERQKYMTGYELQKYTAGYTKCDGVLLRSGTVDLVCQEYARRRQQHKKQRLAWRVSNPKSPRYSLGWVPFRATEIKYRAGQIHHAGHAFSFWDSYGLADYALHGGTFSQDARGRWYFNVAVEPKKQPSAGSAAVGIDLGLKTAVTVSDGRRLEGRLFRASEAKLAKAQRAGKKKLTRAVHAKIRNQRKDALHKFSTKLVAESGAIFVGDVSSAKLVKTTMAKSTYDAGWSMFKTMLAYKCANAGVVFEVVNEAWSTQTCNACGAIAGPKGRAGLNKRCWNCACGAVLDRDVNAAINIRARGLAGLAEGVRNVA